jgi:hypothetical protein
VETDDAFFKRERKEKHRTGRLGHLSMGTIKKGLMEVRGYESVANVIDVMTDDQHYNSCALGKAKMPATPTGKTVRPNRKNN